MKAASEWKQIENNICRLVVERPDHHCGDGLVAIAVDKYVLSSVAVDWVGVDVVVEFSDS